MSLEQLADIEIRISQLEDALGVGEATIAILERIAARSVKGLSVSSDSVQYYTLVRKQYLLQILVVQEEMKRYPSRSVDMIISSMFPSLREKNNADRASRSLTPHAGLKVLIPTLIGKQTLNNLFLRKQKTDTPLLEEVSRNFELVLESITQPSSLLQSFIA